MALNINVDILMFVIVSTPRLASMPNLNRKRALSGYNVNNLVFGVIELLFGVNNLYEATTID